MTPSLSLRSRVLTGAILWTLGLFAVAGVALTQVMVRHPGAPLLVHDLFASTTMVSLAALACMVAGLSQVRRGLSGFNALRIRLAAVRDGRHGRVEGAYPAEVQPLVDDLNALLAAREATIARAVAKAGDLAHGLKTPLAVLAHEADRVAAAGQGDLAASIAQQVERMRRQVDYHLAHARAAASGAHGARCGIRTSAEGLARALLRLYAARGLAIDVHVPAGQTVRAQREDLDEMLGNLLDNACKWARTRVTIDACVREKAVLVSVDDDGPGLEPAMRVAVLQRGVRADESSPGSGLGLAIVRDLAELYGGSLTLTRSPAGGVRAQLQLPS
jgi:signal transduction histidine kinase